MAGRGLLGVALSVACLACVAKPEPPAGFRLPEGDPVRGQEAFVQLRCHSCHRVVGLELPEPVADPPVPVVIGGEIATPQEDEEVMTSIINPSHQIASRFQTEGVLRGESSRMIDLTEAMTVQQMVDLVAFVRSRYTVVP